MKLNWVSMFTDTSHNLNMCFRCKIHFSLFIGLTICLFAFHTPFLLKFVGETCGLTLLQVIIFNLSRIYKLWIKFLTSVGSFPFCQLLWLSIEPISISAESHPAFSLTCCSPRPCGVTFSAFQLPSHSGLLSQTCHTEKNCTYVDT